MRQLLHRPGRSIVASCRDPDSASDLQSLQSAHGADRLHIIQLDSADERSIERAAAEIASRHRHVDLLMNVSGVLHIPGVMSPETSLGRVTMENLERSFRTNAFGPIIVCKALAPLLINAANVTGASK